MGLRVLEPSPSPTTPVRIECPTRLNLGSGRDFRPDCLNVDVDPLWRPDVVADFGRPLLEAGLRCSSERFGEITIGDGTLEEIIAADVLEHIPDLVCAMTNCLRLLREGGKMRVLVPHDLSTGAWSDPTHVRAFNDRSWYYYSDWYWYIGWTDWRFDVVKLEQTLSDLGRELKARGVPDDEIVRTPRAIDSIRVELVKVAVTPEEKKETEALLREGRRELTEPVT